jgi:hypothetical protein
VHPNPYFLETGVDINRLVVKMDETKFNNDCKVSFCVGGEVFGYLQEAIVQEGKNNFHLSIFNDI